MGQIQIQFSRAVDNAIAGDTDTAVSVGHQAIDAVTALSSPRAYDRLRVLNTALEPCTPAPVSLSCASG